MSKKRPLDTNTAPYSQNKLSRLSSDSKESVDMSSPATTVSSGETVDQSPSVPPLQLSIKAPCNTDEDNKIENKVARSDSESNESVSAQSTSATTSVADEVIEEQEEAIEGQEEGYTTPVNNYIRPTSPPPLEGRIIWINCEQLQEEDFHLIHHPRYDVSELLPAGVDPENILPQEFEFGFLGAEG